MSERSRTATFPNGVRLVKWARREEPTAESVAENAAFRYAVYDANGCAVVRTQPAP
jgi:hypothetical protein